MEILAEVNRTSATSQQWETSFVSWYSFPPNYFFFPVGITLVTTHCGTSVGHPKTLSHGTWPSSPCCWSWAGSRQCSVAFRWWMGCLEPSAGTANAAVVGWALMILLCYLVYWWVTHTPLADAQRNWTGLPSAPWSWFSNILPKPHTVAIRK